MDGAQDQDLEDLELFQHNVSNRFADLLSPPQHSHSSTGLLSIFWLRKLVDVFLCCEAEFKAVLIMGREPSHLAKPPLDRLMPELLDRTVKALDICNAVSSGVESVRHCQRLAEIAVAALQQTPITDGQAKRARKALGALVASLEDKDQGGVSHYKQPERSWSFGRSWGSAAPIKDGPPAVSYRSLSMVIGKNWSAAKQIQAMTSNLYAPRGAELTGMALPVYIMNVVLVFVMWALVAAIPCQERVGLPVHIQIPRQFPWAQSIIGLQEKIGEEWKKKEKNRSAGLLDEMQRMEKLSQGLIEFCDGFQFPAGEEEEGKLEEVAAQVKELAEVCRRMEEGLVSLQQQIRDVFHRAVRSRTEVLELLEHAGKLSQAMM
ncbi:Protein ROH1 [Linum grandiflorum]